MCVYMRAGPLSHNARERSVDLLQLQEGTWGPNEACGNCCQPQNSGDDESVLIRRQVGSTWIESKPHVCR